MEKACGLTGNHPKLAPLVQKFIEQRRRDGTHSSPVHAPYPHARFINAVEDAGLRRELVQSTKNGAGRREIERAIAEHLDAESFKKEPQPSKEETPDKPKPEPMAEASGTTITVSRSNSQNREVSLRKDSKGESEALPDAGPGIESALHLLAEAARRLQELALSSDDRSRLHTSIAAVQQKIEHC